MEACFGKKLKNTLSAFMALLSLTGIFSSKLPQMTLKPHELI